MNRMFVRRNIIYISVLLFVISFAVITTLKPGFAYNLDGTLKEFGVGFKKKTVVPLWLIVIILAIFSYLGILYYLLYPKIS